VLELDPSYLTAGGWTPNVLLYERRWDQFLSLVPATGTPLFRFYRGYALFQTGRSDDARAQVAPAFRSSPHDLFARFCQALGAIIEGRAQQAITDVRQIARQRAELGARDGEMTYKQAQLLALAGDREGGASELARAASQGFFCSDCFEQDPALASLRDTATFRLVLTEARQRQAAFAERFALSRQ
jgi:hypothetical protein